MKPSEIVKGAWHRAKTSLSLKAFVRRNRVESGSCPGMDLGKVWLANKAKQRRTKPATGHLDVHRMAETRSNRHSLAAEFVSMRSEVRR